jgi:hypothetical protein
MHTDSHSFAFCCRVRALVLLLMATVVVVAAALRGC